MELPSQQISAAINVAGPCPDKPASDRCETCILDSSDYFSALSLEVKRALQEFLQFKSFDRRALLYREGGSSEKLFILMSGEVKVYKSLSNGRQQIHKLAVIPGDLIACEDIYLDKYSSSAEAISPVTVCYLPKVHLQSVISRHREIPDALMRSMARNLNSYIRNIANLGQKNALERVASYLLFLHETHHERNLHSEELRESLTRTELADMIGVTQRTLIRGLKKLESDKVIALVKDGFRILDQKGLEYLSAGG
jgi:CRP/FNR family transcriptional regulator